MVDLPESGKVGWRSPSNIALVKYWGKRDVQIPANPSISFTLKDAYTESFLHFSKKESDQQFSVEVYLDGQLNEDFKPKILQFFERIKDEFAFLQHYHFRLETSNSFPHSSGIASSASGMSALALCLCSIEKTIEGNAYQKDFFQRASYISRLGSGSACRSVYGGLVLWGQHPSIPKSSDEYAIPLPDNTAEVFHTFRDTILLVDKGKKEVSSTVGHGLMNTNPFSEKRFDVANEQLVKLYTSLQQGKVDDFGKIVEQEALMLHALMMTSDPYFLLFKPNTIKIIEKVWERRNQNAFKMYITLDAGANVHLLYPEFEETRVMKFVENELVAYCENMQYICDSVGSGPTELLKQ